MREDQWEEEQEATLSCLEEALPRHIAVAGGRGFGRPTPVVEVSKGCCASY